MVSEEEQKKIDLGYLRAAWKYAQDNSPDKSTQNGAVIVRSNKIFNIAPLNIISYGANNLSPGVEITEARLERPLKYEFTGHAEENAIINAAKAGKCTDGGIMYAPWFACAPCGRQIVRAGIKKVIGSKWPEKWWTERQNPEDGKNWYDSIGLALEMFNEAGVKYQWVDGDIGGLEILFDGIIREP